MTTRALLVWMALLTVAIINGAVREAWLVPGAGSLGAHQISTLLLSAAILLLAVLTIPWMAPATRPQALLIGAGWLVMTLTFEFLAGHYAFGKSWPVLLADYDIARGRIWILVLITTGLAPLIAASWRGLLPPADRSR